MDRYRAGNQGQRPGKRANMITRYVCIRKALVKTIFMLALGVLTLAGVVGCSHNYGRIHWDEKVTQAFDANQVEPDYKFYQYAIGMQVYAIIGLESELELKSRIWRPLEAGTEDFKVALSRIWYNDFQEPGYPRGADILNPDGEKVGVYFSSLPFVSIDFKPENRVEVMLDTTIIRGGPDTIRTP
jgi:hypothetical protein